MFTRSLAPILAIAVVALLLMAGKTDAVALNLCNRHQVTFMPLAAELTKVYRCTQAVCVGGIVHTEVKQIAAYGQINQWLVSTSSPTTSYSVSQQNAIILNAKTLANANRPAGKIVSGIQFFRDLIVSNSAGAHFVGANITYSQCIKGPPPAS